MNLFCKIGGTQSVSLRLEAKVVSFCMTHFLYAFVFLGFRRSRGGEIIFGIFGMVRSFLGIFLESGE
jgi:hypothetical protein